MLSSYDVALENNFSLSVNIKKEFLEFWYLWGSNPRRLSSADLKSAAFNHSAKVPPSTISHYAKQKTIFIFALLNN